MRNEIYLDNSATTPVAEEVVQAMEPYWTIQYGNPSSPHIRGIAAENTLNASRKQLGNLLQVNPSQLYFTASGTEANNMAIQGVASTPYFLRHPGHIITTPIEHPSVLNVVNHLEELGWSVSHLDVDGFGRINPNEFSKHLRPNTKIVSVMLVNNELGTIEPVSEIGKIIEAENRERQHKIIFHVDAVQALGHLPVRIPELKAHLCSFSAHKIFGPKGVGLLYANRQAQLRPIMFGGNQEDGLRPGTENIPAIVGFTKAAQLVTDSLDANIAQLRNLRRALISGIETIPGARINSPKDGAPHLLNASFAGIRGEVLVHFLEQKRIFVAMGAACSSKKKGASHVLQAIGLGQDEILSAIRFSLAPTITLDQIKYVVYSLKETVEEIRNIYI
ncbi:MAG TPA: cysteine desulfurase NifS [Firmicutes bacterium]|jgi:cysteine desulfurase|nr:cysteine desulfurase NifS [Bacillota bacterium]